MNYKNAYLIDVPANSSARKTIDTATSGWLGVVQFSYDSAATGDVGIQIRKAGNNDWLTIASQAIAAKGEAVWTGNQLVNESDLLRVTNETGTACAVYVTVTYEPFGAGSWQTFAVGEADDSSSSSSSESSSVSSKSSSSQSSSNSSSQTNSGSSQSSSSNSSNSSSSQTNSESSQSSGSSNSSSSQSVSSGSSDSSSSSSVSSQT